MENSDRERIGAHCATIRKRLGDLPAPASESREQYVWSLIYEALDALDGECVPVRRTPRKGKTAPLTAAEQAEEAARRG